MIESTLSYLTKENPPEMFERCLYFNTNTLVRKLNSQWEQAFARIDLTPPQGYLLRVVLDRPGLSQQEVAGELCLEKSTITRFLTVLEKKGFVKRSVVDGNARQKAIFPQPRAVAMKEELEALGDELYAGVCAALGEDNVKSFVAMSRQMAQSL
ncbi:MAG: MarR family transcriptional regulator [Gammaproteobacteria bacterium]|nr:MarR family transcriptional regulator [Gammaproteobacteria bacterium]